MTIWLGSAALVFVFFFDRYVDHRDLHRIDDVAFRLELSDGLVAVGRAGMARHEDQFAVARSLGAPFEELRRLDRAIVVVYTEQREIEIVAWICEVVGVAPEKRHLLLGREDEPDVGVFLVA